MSSTVIVLPFVVCCQLLKYKPEEVVQVTVYSLNARHQEASDHSLAPQGWLLVYNQKTKSHLTSIGTAQITSS